MMSLLWCITHLSLFCIAVVCEKVKLLHENGVKNII